MHPESSVAINLSASRDEMIKAHNSCYRILEAIQPQPESDGCGPEKPMCDIGILEMSADGVSSLIELNASLIRIEDMLKGGNEKTTNHGRDQPSETQDAADYPRHGGMRPMPSARR